MKTLNIANSCYYYNNMGCLVSELSSEGKKHFYYYNRSNQLIAEVFSDGELHCFEYNRRGKLIKKIVFSLKIDIYNWTYKNFPVLKKINVKSHRDDFIEHYFYNVNDSLCHQINNKGLIITYSYNLQGLLKSKNHYVKNFNTSDFHHLIEDDEITLEVSNLTATCSYFYSKQKLLIAEIKANGNTTEFIYNSFRQCVSIKHYYQLALAPLSKHWKDSKPSENNLDRITYYFYNSNHQRVALIDEDTHLHEYFYNAEQLTHVIIYANPVILNKPLVNQCHINEIRPIPSSEDTTIYYDNNIRMDVKNMKKDPLRKINIDRFCQKIVTKKSVFNSTMKNNALSEIAS